ncbi:hypothetical protein RSAG8_11008, partial [Rhizoctonia solani AG-8 WAC10335]
MAGRCLTYYLDGSVQVSPVKDGNTDRWSKTYTSKEKTSSGSASSSNRGSRNSSGLPPLGMLNMDFNKDDDSSPPPRTPPPSDALGTSHTNLAALPPVQRSPGRRAFPKPLNHSSRVGPRATSTTRPSSPLKQAYIPPKHDSPPSGKREQSFTDDDDLPSIADEELGDLTNTLGSTIQPKETLPVQLCASCDEPFATDAARYPGLDDPRGITGVFYCRQCFKDNGGLKGHCAACGNEVLMGRHDGSSVTVRDKLYHSKCFKCSHCGNKVDRGHCCDPTGKPCCEPCLEKVLNAPSGPSSPTTTRVTRKSGPLNDSGSEDRRNSTPRGPPRGSITPNNGNTSDSAPTRPRESMSFLEELKQRQSAGGGAPSPSAIRRETLRSRSKSREPDRQRQRDEEQEHDQDKGRERDRPRDRDRDRDREKQRDRERDRERGKERNKEREREREREKEREKELEQEREREREAERELERELERSYDHEEDDHEQRESSPINPDMIRRDTMGPRKAGGAIRRAREREREREQGGGSARRESRDPGEKPPARNPRRSASRPRERSTSPPPARRSSNAQPLRRSTSKGALKQKERSVSPPGGRRGRGEDDPKPKPIRSALRSASRPRISDPKTRRERERSKSPPPKDTAPMYPVGKLTRDLGSLTVGLASGDDSSSIVASDSHSSIARSEYTSLSSTSAATSLRSSTSPSSIGTSEIKPILKTRRSIISFGDTTGSESPSTLAKARRPIRSSLVSRDNGPETPKASAIDPFDAPKAEEEDLEADEDMDRSMDRSMDKDLEKQSTPSRLPRRSIGRDSPASTTGTVTPSRLRSGAPSSGKKPSMGDYHEPEEHRTSWLRNREARARSFVKPRGDFSDTSNDSLPWGMRSTKSDNILPSRSVAEPEQFSPPPVIAPMSNPSSGAPSRAPSPSKRRSKADDSVMPIDSTERCSMCNEKLHLDGGNMFVTVPGYAKTGNTGEYTPARTFHVDCFKCSVCELPFGGDAWEGQQARFVQLKDVIAHPECAPPIVRTATYTPTPTKLNRVTKSQSLPAEPPLRSAPAVSRPTPTVNTGAAPVTRSRSGTTAQPAPRFGGAMYCPACSKSVSPMELGTCPGPNGSRWHSSCLVCGGKDAKKNRKNPRDPGCGKQLDSGAKYDQEGGVWCRECIDKLPAEMRPSSPIKPIVPTHTGSKSWGRASGSIVAQYTGVSVNNTGGILKPQTTGGGGFIRPQATGGGGIIKPQTTGGGGILKPQTTGGGGILKPQTTGGGGILKPQTTGGGGFIRPQLTGRSAGGVTAQYTGGSIGGLVPQLTGGGLPITMQLTGGSYRRAATKSVGNFEELEAQYTGGRAYDRPVSALGGEGFRTAMSLARRGVSMSDADEAFEPPVRERPKSAYGLRSWKI